MLKFSILFLLYVFGIRWSVVMWNFRDIIKIKREKNIFHCIHICWPYDVFTFLIIFLFSFFSLWYNIKLYRGILSTALSKITGNRTLFMKKPPVWDRRKENDYFQMKVGKMLKIIFAISFIFFSLVKL